MLRFSKYLLPSGFHDKYLSLKRAMCSTYLIHLDLITVSRPHKLIKTNDGLFARIEDSAEGDSDHFRTCHQQTTGISLVRDSLPDTKQMSYASRNNLINLTARSTVHYRLTAPSPSRTILLPGSGQKTDS